MAKQAWTGVYSRAGEGEPVALFRDGRQANAFRTMVLGEPRAVIATIDLDVPTHEGARDVLAGQPQPKEPAGAKIVDELDRAQIRSQVVADQRRERLEREVRSDLKAPRASEVKE